MNLRVALIIVVCYFSDSLLAQNASQYYKRLKNTNISVSNFSDSTFLISYKSIGRFTDDTSKFTCSFMFYSKELNNFSFVRADEYGGLQSFRPEMFYHINLKGDTTIKEPIDPYHFDSKHSSSMFFSLNNIPTKKKKDFSRIKYTKPKVVSVNNDTIVISQFERKWKDERLLYFTNDDYRVFKVVFRNNDFNRPDAYSSFDITYFKQNCFDSINKEHKLRKYHEREYYKNKESEVINSLNQDTVFLQKDSFITELRGKYILFDYWYLSCSPCLQMMPFMKKLQTEIDTSKLIIIGANPYDEEKYVQRYLEERDYLSLQMDMLRMRPYHDLNEFPQLILVDENFKTVKVIKGYGKGSNFEIRLYLKSLGLMK